MREIETADAAGGPHGAAFSELDAGDLLRVEQLPENPLFGVIGAGGIAGGGPDAAILFFDQLFETQILIRTVAPLVACALVQILSERFSEPVGQRFRYNGVVVVVVGVEWVGRCFEGVAGGDSERAEVVGGLMVGG